MESWSVTMRSVCTSISTPPSWRRWRHPLSTSERLTAVTYFGRPSCMARPLRWHRSSAASLEMNSGFQIGRKPYFRLTVARHENLVFTKTMRPVLSTESSCTSTSPTVWALRGTNRRSK